VRRGVEKDAVVREEEVDMMVEGRGKVESKLLTSLS
jgi:hypothetical protein